MLPVEHWFAPFLFPVQAAGAACNLPTASVDHVGDPVLGHTSVLLTFSFLFSRKEFFWQKVTKKTKGPTMRQRHSEKTPLLPLLPSVVVFVASSSFLPSGWVPGLARTMILLLQGFEIKPRSS